MPPRAWVGLALVTLAYLAGSISFARIVARRRGVDLEAGGSGNPGATNVGRLLGKRAGRLVLVADALKGAVPLAAARGLLGIEDPWTAASGIAAVIGHCLPVWHRLRGGKGAATAAGVMLVAEPIAGGSAVLAYLGAKRATQRASVGSLAGALCGAVVTVALRGPRTTTAWMAVAIAVLVWVRHADNLARLARGTEPPS